MPHGNRLPDWRNSDLQGDQENWFEGWIPTLLVSIAVIGMFLSVVAVLLGTAD